jgi:branched-chain amino acid aminotransferase
VNDAQRRGFDEALLLNSQGLVAEGSGENLFVVKDGGLVTNDRDASILMGVTRASVLEIARDLGIAARINPISVEELMTADELFFTGTAVEVTAIREIDGHIVSGGKPGPITRRIQDTFNQAVRGQLAQYRHWLSFVRQEVRA